jgi:hypothetical protein
MLSCCEKLGYHTHAAILCQFLQPVDYELAFGILKNNVESTVDSLFVHFWDMTIIEYLICILNELLLASQFSPSPFLACEADTHVGHFGCMHTFTKIKRDVSAYP